MKKVSKISIELKLHLFFDCDRLLESGFGKDASMKSFLEKALPFWNNLTKEQRELLEEYGIETEFHKGDIIFNPLKKSAGLKIVYKGQMKICLPFGNEGDIMLYLVKEGEVCILSVMSLMKQFEWAIYAQAIDETRIITIPENVYMKISQENPAVMAYNQKILIERMGEIIQITSHAAGASIPERLADLLLRYQKDDPGMELELTHEELAKDMGSAREVISRTLRQFQKQGLIQTGRGKITILDLERLRQIKQGKMDAM